MKIIVLLACGAYILGADLSRAETDLRSREAAAGVPERRDFTPAARIKTMLEPFNCEDNIVFKIVPGPDGKEEKLEFLFIKPKAKKFAKMPLVIYTHGGGWANGDRYMALWPNAVKAVTQLGENGIAVALIEYRTTRKGVSTAYDCVVDCKDAARYFTADAARFGIDPERLAVWGGSAGGHLCLMTALGSDDKFPGDPAFKGVVPKFRAVCSWFPATTFLDPAVLKGSNFELPGRWAVFLGGASDEKKELAKILSPVEYLKPDSVPVLLIHGDQDKVLPLTGSTYMLQRAKQAGAPVELLVVKGAGHGFAGTNITPSLDEVQARTADFLTRHLLEP
jgi:acetyl esterase/lipase